VQRGTAQRDVDGGTVLVEDEDMKGAVGLVLEEQGGQFCEEVVARGEVSFGVHLAIDTEGREAEARLFAKRVKDIGRARGFRA